MMNAQGYQPPTPYAATATAPNPFNTPVMASEEGNPFDAIPDVADFGRKREFVNPAPDYSDGGVYEDDFGPEDPYTNYTPQTGSTSQPPPIQSPPHITRQEDLFPGEEVDFDTELDTSTVDDNKHEEEEDPKKFHIWNIAYYRGYFNVDTKEVGNRILRSVAPYSMSFFDSVKENPDLYGPFWIATTLIFIMAASGNFANYLHDSDNFSYDFRTVTFGSGAIYGYISIIPILLWITFRWLAVSLGLVQIVCIYGYSLFVFIPIAVLCIIPIDWLRWVLIEVATFDSIVFLVMNFFPPLIKNNLAESKKVLGGLIIIAIVSLLHFGLGLTFKLYFFDYRG